MSYILKHVNKEFYLLSDFCDVFDTKQGDTIYCEKNGVYRNIDEQYKLPHRKVLASTELIDGLDKIYASNIIELIVKRYIKLAVIFGMQNSSDSHPEFESIRANEYVELCLKENIEYEVEVEHERPSDSFGSWASFFTGLGTRIKVKNGYINITKIK